MDSARALVAKGRGIAMVSHTMGVITYCCCMTNQSDQSVNIRAKSRWQKAICAGVQTGSAATMSKNCGSHSRWTAATAGPQTVQDVMLRSVEKRVGDKLPDTVVQWLTDNGSAYTAHETRRFARELNLEPCTIAVSSPQSNGMAERFVKTMKEDYIAFMAKTDVITALQNLAAAGIVNSSYKSCPEMAGQDHHS